MFPASEGRLWALCTWKFKLQCPAFCARACRAQVEGRGPGSLTVQPSLPLSGEGKGTFKRKVSSPSMEMTYPQELSFGLL